MEKKNKLIKIYNKLLQLVKNYWILVITLLILPLTFGKPLLTFITFTVGFGLWRLWLRRDQFIVIKQYIETMVWGKPLRRDLWEKGELKNTKVKIVWGRKNEKNKG